MKRAKPNRRPDTAAALRRLRVALGGRGWFLLVWPFVFGGAAYGLHKLEPYARAATPPPECRLQFANLPQWLAGQKEVLAEIERAADLRSDDDIYATDLCRYVAENLAKCAWIAQVERVSKQPDGLVRVYAAFRKPLTYVIAKDKAKNIDMAYLVDETGVRLPNQLPAGKVNMNEWLVITGVRGRVPEVGAAWKGGEGDGDLAAGLKLAQKLYRAEAAGRLPFRNHLKAVDVSDFDASSGRLRILTVHHPRNPRGYILWGRPPGEEYNIEGSADHKLMALELLYANYGGQLPDDANGESQALKWPIDVRPNDGTLLIGPR